ncbi:restriction endonuclease subunit S [Empedobacter falsenii]|uniref:restriction endonuclease subunit S n=1 Tax=Empedobacter falsenii TaxID=343874 RepID=UPI001C872A1E|nr:restriction endonuclease subunit S [Empedobacter falsenii]
MRFPEFEGEWETKKLGEIATFSKGKGISKSDIEENGIIECIRYGELYTHYREVINEIKSKTNVNPSTLVLSEKNDVIIPASGETTIDIATASCVLKSGIALGGDLNIIKTNNNGIFLSYYLNSKKKMEIANLAQGISVVHLYSSQLSSLSLAIPKLNEQNKISSFLALLDKRIQTQSKIIKELLASKATFAKKIFSQEFRFKDNNGNDFSYWEEILLGDVLDYEQPTNYLVTSTEYDNSFETPVVTAGKTFVLGYTNEIKGIFEKEKLPVIIFDDFTTASQFVNFPFKAKSSAMKILKAKNKNNIKFLFEAIQMIAYETGGHGRHWISIFSNLEIMLPSFDEQTKIANFLSSIDSKIEVENQLLQKLKEQKKFLLQQMFV